MQKTLILHSEKFEPLKLKVGTHEYFGQTIKTTPIRTTFAVCYRVKSKSEFVSNTGMLFVVYDQWRKVYDDKIDKGTSMYYVIKIWGFLTPPPPSPLCDYFQY